MAEWAALSAPLALAAGCVIAGVYWFRQGVPVSHRQKLTGPAGKALAMAIIALGLAVLGLSFYLAAWLRDLLGP